MLLSVAYIFKYVIVFLSNVVEVSMKNCFSQDSTVPGLLVFCHCTPLTGTPLYSQSLLILQDKVKCMQCNAHFTLNVQKYSSSVLFRLVSCFMCTVNGVCVMIDR